MANKREAEEDRAATEVADRLRQRGVAVTGAERSDDLADLLSAVERFEKAVEAHGGDLMVDDLKSPQPDDRHFVLPPRGLEHELVDKTKSPVFPGLEAAHDRMFGLVKMLRGMPVDRVVAAADVTALEAEPQVYPLVAAGQTFLAPIGRLRLDVADLREMLALLGHAGSSSVGC